MMIARSCTISYQQSHKLKTADKSVALQLVEVTDKQLAQNK